MICLQPFTPIYKQEDYTTKVNLSSSSTNSTISVSSTEMTSMTEYTESTTMTVINDNLHKLLIPKFNAGDELEKLEKSISKRIGDEIQYDEEKKIDEFQSIDDLVNYIESGNSKNNKKKKKKKKIKTKLNKININKENKENLNNNENKKVIYTSLKELTTFSRDFILLVRIIKKSEIKVFETRNTNNSNILTGQGRLFYFIVLDQEGNEMQCTCFNKAVDKFFDIIEEDQLYEIKGGYVKINDKKYTRIKSDYKIVLDENSKITKKIDNGTIKKNNMTIVHIKDIQNMNLYSIIDLCCVVLNVGKK